MPDEISRQLPEYTRDGNRSGPISPEQREDAKQRILEALGRTDVIQRACEYGGVTRRTFSLWRKEGFITDDEIAEAHEVYLDYVRSEIAKRAFIGVKKPLLSSGRQVKDDMGQPIFMDVADGRLLEAIAKAMLPEWKQTQQIEVITRTASGIPEEYELIFDLRELSEVEIQMLTQVTQAVEERRLANGNPVIEGSIAS